ncbi:MAG TPA: hypothetical protein PK665_15055 [Ignavibacteriaceae bacterium]|nr:hypothetical protein [Ignavibacteriaceae bacterium]
MDKNKTKTQVDYQGTWMRLKIPTELHTNIRIDGLREKKNLDIMVLKYLQLGYEAFHNGYKARAKNV